MTGPSLVVLDVKQHDGRPAFTRITINRAAADHLRAWKRRTWEEVLGYATGQTAYARPESWVGRALAQFKEIGGRSLIVVDPQYKRGEAYTGAGDHIVFCAWIGGPEPHGYYIAG